MKKWNSARQTIAVIISVLAFIVAFGMISSASAQSKRTLSEPESTSDLIKTIISDLSDRGDQRQSSGGFVANPDRREAPECGNSVCWCVGDDDCNEMFTTLCSDDESGDQCFDVDGETVCTCTAR